MLVHEHSMLSNFFDLRQSGVSLEFRSLSSERPIVLLILGRACFPPHSHTRPWVRLGSTLPLASRLEEKAHWGSGRGLDAEPATCPLCDLD